MEMVWYKDFETGENEVTNQTDVFTGEITWMPLQDQTGFAYTFDLQDLFFHLFTKRIL